MTDEHAAMLRETIARQVASLPLEIIQDMFRRLDAKDPEVSISCTAGVDREDGKPVSKVTLYIEPAYYIPDSDTVVQLPGGVFARIRSPEVGGTGEVERKEQD